VFYFFGLEKRRTNRFVINMALIRSKRDCSRFWKEGIGVQKTLKSSTRLKCVQKFYEVSFWLYLQLQRYSTIGSAHMQPKKSVQQIHFQSEIIHRILNQLDMSYRILCAKILWSLNYEAQKSSCSPKSIFLPQKLPYY